MSCEHPVEDFCVKGDQYFCAKCKTVLNIEVPEWATAYLVEDED